MGKFKKKQFYIGFLLLFFTVFIGTSESYCYQDFNITSGDLRSIYKVMRDNSLYYSIIEDITYHNTVVQRWASGDEFIDGIDDSEWSDIEVGLNSFMHQFWVVSGEYYNIYGYDSEWMRDDMLWSWVVPAPRTTDNAALIFTFAPYISTRIQGMETRPTVSGEYVYSTTTNVYNRDMSGEITNVNCNHLISLVLKPNGTYDIYTSRTGLFYSADVSRSVQNNQYWYRRNLPNPYYQDSGYVYFIGLLQLTRQNNNINRFWSYHPYTVNYYVDVKNGFSFNLDNKSFVSGDLSSSNPSNPSGENSGNINVDLTETNGLISGVINALTDDDFSGEFMSSGDFSGELINSLHLSTIDNLGDSFFLALWEGLRQALLSEDGKIYEVPFLDSSFIMDADVFIINNEPLNSFFRIGSILGFIMVEYKLLYLIFRTAQTGGFADIIRFLYHKDYTNFL